jgi:N-formylglutamate amidohydrolase
MEPTLWYIREGESPLVATAIHTGHEIRHEVAERLVLHESDRLREEDPFTGNLTTVAQNRLTVFRSRFEVDVNRPREKAFYIRPEDAWGLHLWKQQPPKELIERSLEEYDRFYAEVKRFLTGLECRFGQFVVFDLHSYNHLRDGPDGPPADPALNPEVNVGTGTMDRERWASIVDRFMNDLRTFDFLGRPLDVRENVKFKGGQFSRWIHQTFPETGCAMAIEFKKFFMNEWTGELYHEQFDAIKDALQSTVPGVLEALTNLKK